MCVHGCIDITFRNIILEIYAFERNIVIPVKFHISIGILKKKDGGLNGMTLTWAPIITM